MLLSIPNDDYNHDNYVGDDDYDDEIVDDIDPENSSCHQHLLPSKILWFLFPHTILSSYVWWG